MTRVTAPRPTIMTADFPSFTPDAYPGTRFRRRRSPPTTYLHDDRNPPFWPGQVYLARSVMLPSASRSRYSDLPPQAADACHSSALRSTQRTTPPGCRRTASTGQAGTKRETSSLILALRGNVAMIPRRPSPCICRKLQNHPPTTNAVKLPSETAARASTPALRTRAATLSPLLLTGGSEGENEAHFPIPPSTLLPALRSLAKPRRTAVERPHAALFADPLGK